MKAPLLGWVLAAAAALQGAPTDLTVSEIHTPAVPVPSGPALASDRTGGTWLAWVQPAAGGQALFSAQLANGRGTGYVGDSRGTGYVRDGALEVDGRGTGYIRDGWGTGYVVASSPGGLAPALCASAGGRLAAVWLLRPDRDRGFVWARSRDGGRNWESSQADWPCAAADACVLGNGEVLAAWSPSEAPEEIQVRFLTGPYAQAPPYTVARDAAGRFFQLRPLLDGGALLAYVQQVAPGRLTVITARLHGRRWHKGRGISLPAGEPANLDALRFDVDGGRVALAWARGGRLWTAFSPDAGARFSQPVALGPSPPSPSPSAPAQAPADISRFPGSAAVEGADIALLHDTAAVAVYRIGDRLWVERISPEATPGTAMLIKGAGAAGDPRIVLAHDYAGANDSATLVVASRSTQAMSLQTFLIHVPEAQLLSAAADDCHCAPTPQQLLGYPVRGTVLQLDLASRTLVLTTDAIAGVMDAGEHSFSLAKSEHPILQAGDECLGRIQDKSGAWEIFDLRRLGNPAPERKP